MNLISTPSDYAVAYRREAAGSATAAIVSFAITETAGRRAMWADVLGIFGEWVLLREYARPEAEPFVISREEYKKALVASADRSPEGGDHEDGRHAKHESAAPKADAQGHTP